MLVGSDDLSRLGICVSSGADGGNRTPGAMDGKPDPKTTLMSKIGDERIQRRLYYIRGEIIRDGAAYM